MWALPGVPSEVLQEERLQRAISGVPKSLATAGIVSGGYPAGPFQVLWFYYYDYHCCFFMATGIISVVATSGSLGGLSAGS